MGTNFGAIATPELIPGPDTDSFSIITQPKMPFETPPVAIAPGGTRTFVVRFSANSEGQKTVSFSIVNSDSATGLRSLLIETDGKGELIVAKRLSLPSRVPFGVSGGNFAIGAGQIVAQGQIVSRSRLMDERRRERQGKDNDAAESRTRQASGTDTGSLRAASDGSSGSASGTAKMMSASPVGNFYIYSFDGKLLQLYNVYGTLLKDYIYMGDRLIAEYDHVGARLLYYTPDQINTTRVITDQGGNVVYSVVHDPYGGIQQTGQNNTFDPQLKFSGKERDTESELDYFGARYYDRSQYRFISVDPALRVLDALSKPSIWNGYAFCRNNPMCFFDPTGGYEIQVNINYIVVDSRTAVLGNPRASGLADLMSVTAVPSVDSNGNSFLLFKLDFNLYNTVSDHMARYEGFIKTGGEPADTFRHEMLHITTMVFLLNHKLKRIEDLWKQNKITTEEAQARATRAAMSAGNMTTQMYDRLQIDLWLINPFDQWLFMSEVMSSPSVSVRFTEGKK